MLMAVENKILNNIDSDAIIEKLKKKVHYFQKNYHIK